MKKSLILFVAMMTALPVATAWGQKDFAQPEDGPVGIFQSRAEYNQFMGGAKQAAYGENGNSELQAMIPMLNDIALNKPVGWTANEYNTTGSTLGLLSDPDIRAEIEMVDEQYKELQDMSSQIQKRAGDQLRKLDFSDRDNLVKQIGNIREQATSDINNVLLPHQLERLKQIRMQALLQRRSLVEVLTSDPVKSDLEITDSQSAELKDFEKEVHRDLAKEIAKLQEKARDRLLSKLNPSQKNQAQEMIGEAFEFTEKRKNDKSRRKAKGEKTKGKGKGKFKG